MKLKPTKENIIITLSLIATLLKVLMIDFDPPKWDIAFYQPIDELYYTYIAFNLYEAGTFFNGDKIQVFGNPWLTNFITYLTLNLFGKTYLGLRFSSVIFASISVLLLWKIIKKVIFDFRVRCIIMLLFVINYPMTLASLIIEPSIARIAMSLFTFLLLLSYYERKPRRNSSLFFISSIITAGVLFTYPTNAYLIPFMAFALTFMDIHSNQFKSSIINSLSKKLPIIILGIIAGSVMWVLFSFLLGENILEGMNRGKHYSNRVSFSLKGAIINLLSFFKANIFLLNPILLLLFIHSALSLSRTFILKKSYKPEFFLLFTFWSFFLLQTVFINDFPERKLIVIFPFVLLTIGLYLDAFLKKEKSNSVSVATWGISILIFSLILFLIPPKTGQYIEEKKYLLFAVIFIPFFATLIFKKQKNTFIYLIVLIAIIEVHNTFKFSINEQSKNYLATFKKLEEFNGDNLIGGWSTGFMLYNKMTVSPNLNRYLYYGEPDEFWSKVDSISRLNGKIDLSVGYEKDSISYNRIGFEKVATILKAENSVYNQDLVLYKEK